MVERFVDIEKATGSIPVGRTNMNPKIIYEDGDALVINKPAGLLVHPVKISSQISKINEPTLADWLTRKYPEIKQVGEDPLRPGIVHRLDKDTSGVMIIAKNQPAFEFLKRQFAEKKVKKIYLALVAGELNPPTGGKKGIINLPIGRSKKNPTLRLASPKARGKLREAITEYKILEIFRGAGKNCTLLKAYPKTGRTHQIRAHFKAIGHPVVCDKLYSKKTPCPEGLNRQFLHSYSLEITLPDGNRGRFETNLPDDLEKALAQLRESVKYDKNNG